MMNINPTTLQYDVLGKTIQIQSEPNVWAPYSASEMMNFLGKYGYLEEVAERHVLDLGTGSGLVGIACALMGAKSITLTDYSAPAVKLAVQNATLNGTKAEGLQSDRFEALLNRQFDLIISNPPVQPWLFTDTEHPENRLDAASWNEAGKDGRLVLDALIREGYNHLNSQGIMIISCSSRHGHRFTKELLNMHWGKNWRRIYEAEHAIDESYHAPYVPTWLALQRADLDLRIYQKDDKGRKFARYRSGSAQEQILMKLDLQGDSIPVIMEKQAERGVYEVRNQTGKVLMEIPEGDACLPNQAIDEHWYYKYYLIQAERLR